MSKQESKKSEGETPESTGAEEKTENENGGENPGEIEDISKQVEEKIKAAAAEEERQRKNDETPSTEVTETEEVKKGGNGLKIAVAVGAFGAVGYGVYRLFKARKKLENDAHTRISDPLEAHHAGERHQ